MLQRLEWRGQNFLDEEKFSPQARRPGEKFTRGGKETLPSQKLRPTGQTGQTDDHFSQTDANCLVRFGR